MVAIASIRLLLDWNRFHEITRGAGRQLLRYATGA
jgi:hypothetical protein